MAAGMAPVALGTETDGSIWSPATELIFILSFDSGKGLHPRHSWIHTLNGHPGAYEVITEDVAVLLGLLTPIEGKSHRDFLTKSLTGIRIGFLGPAVWAPTADAVRPNADFTVQIESYPARQFGITMHPGASRVNSPPRLRR